MRRQAIIAALLIVGVAVVLGATAFRTDIAQATGLAQSVTVVNTSANPVPVHEQGTANVNVANTPTVTSVPGLPGTPFSKTASASIQVPNDKHLVVETVSVDVDAAGATAATSMEAYVNYVTGGNQAQLFIAPGFTYLGAGGFGTFAATEDVRLYLDPGTSIYVSGHCSCGITGTLFLTVSGYLVPA